MLQPWERLGCSEDLYVQLRSMHSDYNRCPVGRYGAHIRNAAARGVPFRLTLAEWWKIWEKSGHWAERGTCRGQYNMARLYDRGSYEVGNVEIVTCYENAMTRTMIANARRGAYRSKGGGRGFSKIDPPSTAFKSMERLVADNG